MASGTISRRVAGRFLRPAPLASLILTIRGTAQPSGSLGEGRMTHCLSTRE